MPFLHAFFVTVLLAIFAFQILYCLARPKQIKILDIAILAVLMYFALGPIISYFYGGGEFMLAYTAEATATAYMGVLLFVLGCFLARILIRSRRHVRPEGFLHALLSDPHQISARSVVAVFVPYLILTLLLTFVYDVRLYASSTGGSEGALPYWVIVARSFAGFFENGVLLWAIAALCKRITLNPLAWVVVGSVVFLNLLTTNRRWFLETGIILVFVVLIVRGSFSWRFILTVVTTILIAWFFILPQLWLLRVAYGHATGDNAWQRMQNTVDVYQHEVDTEYELEQQNKNLAGRSFIMLFNMSIAEAENDMPFMMGRALRSSLEANIPRFVYSFMGSGKVFYSSEAYAELWFFGSMGDTSGNWPAIALADGGLVASLLYGFLFGASIMALEWLSMRVSTRLAIVGVCICGHVLRVALSVEQTPETLWSIMRDALILVIFVSPLLMGRPARHPHDVRGDVQQFVTS